MVAAAALASARRMLKMTPIWPCRLAKLTQSDFGRISQCADHIWRYAAVLLPRLGAVVRTNPRTALLTPSLFVVGVLSGRVHEKEFILTPTELAGLAPPPPAINTAAAIAP